MLEHHSHLRPHSVDSSSYLDFHIQQGDDLVMYIKCSGRNTLKHVYVKVGTRSSSLSPHSLDLADCNEMENLKMKCKGDDGKIYQSRISYCKSDPIQPGCEFILSGNY